ncbi:MAG: hypothetical protein KAV82_10680 [Phycisphaerae bacterium]|nr:hypothetical protein [Phycisphaerae bacterium]
MNKPLDEYDAVRIIVDTLGQFNEQEQDYILRWVRERLAVSPAAQEPSTPPPPPTRRKQTPAVAPPPPESAELKAFMDSKNTQKNYQFVTAVAYYYKHEAPAGERKDEIRKQDLIAACRKVGRSVPPFPAQTLINTYQQGFLDKGSRDGLYRANLLGKQLIDGTLPKGKRPGTIRMTKKRKTQSRKKK